MLPDGATRWISSLGRVERDATGRPVRIRGTSREVTVQKRAELAVRNLSGRLLSAQEEERRRIARELHDNLGQQVSLLAIEIEQVAMTSVAGSLRQIGARTAEISSEIHNLSHRLHSVKLEALGLAVAVQGHCRELRGQGLQVTSVVENVPGALSYEVALCLFRVVQEGLNNVIKHSGAGAAQVLLRGTNDALLLSIADSGRGFETDVSGRAGLGLASIAERLRLIGGEVTIRSRPGRGTTIDARVPLAHEARMTAADTVALA
jgi:signal transduction histidine kinase